MKNFILLFSLISLLTSCNDKDHSHEVQTNGFTTNEGQTIMMGSQSSVDVFKEMDKAWGARDYDLLKTFIADDSDLRFENGKTASNGLLFSPSHLKTFVYFFVHSKTCSLFTQLAQPSLALTAESH